MSSTTPETLQLNVNDKNLFNKFYKEKSIVETYNFGVLFVDGNATANGTPIKLADIIKPWHIIDIDIPATKLQRESTNYGVFQFSYPTVSREQAYDIKITLEEDLSGSITELIGMLYETVANRGLHRPIHSMRALGKIIVVLYDTMKHPIIAWEYTECFFLGAENMSFNYEDTGTLRYVITFGSDTCTIIRDDLGRLSDMKKWEQEARVWDNIDSNARSRALEENKKEYLNRSTLVGKIRGGLTGRP